MSLSSLQRYIDKRIPVGRWIALLALSTFAALVLNAANLPAAWLLGPLVAGAALAAIDRSVKIPGIAFALSQGILGCMIARALPLSLAGEVLQDWPLFVIGVLFVIAASSALGWILTRARVLPGTTVVWGLSPGAAAVMTILSENFGADSQFVAFMQYTRVVFVAGLASIIATAVDAHVADDMQAVVWFPPIAWIPLAETLALAIAGPLLGRLFRLQAGAFVIPMLAGIALTHMGAMEIELPPWLLSVAYAFIGWRIGLRFTRPLLLHALKALPGIAASMLALIAACGLLAGAFVVFADIDPLTAYLATSPGGADSVAIIAASSNVDVPFVMTMQMARFFVVLITGPAIARYVSRKSLAASQPPA